MKKILFRADYFCTPTYVASVADMICENIRYEMMFRKLSDLEKQECDIESVFENLYLNKYELENVNKEPSYIFFKKTDRYINKIIVNRYFVSCIFDIIENDDIEKDIRTVYETVEKTLHESNKVNIVTKICSVMDNEYVEKEFSEGFVESESSVVRIKDNVRLKSEERIFEFSSEDDKGRYSRVVKRTAITDDMESDDRNWSGLYNEVKHKIYG